MKNKQTKTAFMPVLFMCFCLALLGYGCLGLGGGGGNSSSSIINPNSPLSISGKVFFKDRQIYGNIPVTVTNIQGEQIAVTTTDSSGKYSFSGIEPGVYNLSAISGESEVIFAKLIQVTGQGATEVSSVSLLSINNVVIDEIGTNSFHLEFTTNQSCIASVDYNSVGGYVYSKTIDTSARTKHETTISNLNFLTEYEIIIHLNGDDGQQFIMKGLTAHTLGLAGCSDISVNINNGAYETKNRSVTLYLNAEDCEQMRISEDYSLEDANWIAYSTTYSHTFSNTSSGIKRLYVQFKSKNGTLSPVESDSIIYSSSGYLGIWINDGESLTNKSNVKLTLVLYPGASQMIISDNENFSNAFWEMYTSSRSWNLTGEEGLKYLYCKFKGGKADPEEVFTASIRYSTTPPTVEVVINNGANAVATAAVELKFLYSFSPSHMKVANDSAPDANQDWTVFKTPLKWTLSSGDGEKTVYALFKDSAGNEFGPVSAGITVDTVAPTGNTITVRESDSATSGEVTSVLIENLPVYLHFDITDTSTYKAYYCFTIATLTPPDSSEYSEIYSPFSPIELTTSNVHQGDNKVWALFADEAGNISYAQTTELTVEGPELIATPTRVILTAGQEQIFKTILNNVEPTEVGAVRWSVASGSGNIDSDGVYRAPDIVYGGETVTIRASSPLIPSLKSDSIVVLEPSIQLAYLQTNGNYTIEPLAKQIAPGSSISFNIYTFHSNNGIKLTSTPSVGTVSLSKAEVAQYGSIATITYTVPRSFKDVTTVDIGFCANDSSSVTGKIKCTISDGANISLTPSSYIAQRNFPVTITADVSNTSLNTINWSISPNTAGFYK